MIEAQVTLLTDGTSYWDGGGAFGLVPRGYHPELALLGSFTEE
jgi:hypothetical protein